MSRNRSGKRPSRRKARAASATSGWFISIPYQATQRWSHSVLGAGILAGFPVVDIKVELIDGAYNDVDSSALAFEIASRAALREALQKGGSVLLEPVMKVEVVSPEEYTGSVIGDLNSRRGQIQGQDMRGNANVINAMVPLSGMIGYDRRLHSLAGGRATVAMSFSHYAPASSPGWDPSPPAAPAMALRA
jgi:translation elongation factor EF-G